MADRVKIWLDTESDFLEVRFREGLGYLKETENDAVMERVDSEGHLLGFTVQGFSRFKTGTPLEAELLSV